MTIDCKGNLFLKIFINDNKTSYFVPEHFESTISCIDLLEERYNMINLYELRLKPDSDSCKTATFRYYLLMHVPTPFFIWNAFTMHNMCVNVCL